MRHSISILLFFLLLPLTGFAQQTIKGKVIDSTSEEPLSYTSIAVPNSSTGTMTNAIGEFELQLKEGQSEIQISYIGYLDTIVRINAVERYYEVELKAYEYQLSEIIVRPLSPLEYIKEALAKHPDLIATEPFTTRSFFAAKSSVENNNSDSYKLDEAIFNTYFSDYANDTLKEASQLLLHRPTVVGDFTSILEENKRLNKKKKKEKKSDKVKENEVANEEEESEVTFSLNDFTDAGPNATLRQSKSLTTLSFFNSEYFKKFNYTFGDQTYYQGRELIRINFFNKRKVEQSYFKGSVYLDYKDLAIVAVEYNERVKIPGYINLLLKTVAGFSLDGIEQDVKIRNQFIDSKWYPKEVLFDLDLTIKQKGVLEVISIAQILNIEEIEFENPSDIDPNKVFDSEGEYEDQVHPVEEISWDKVNVIELK